MFGAESISAFRTVCSLVMEDSICERYDRLLHGHIMSAYKKARWTTLIFAFSESIGLACQALVLWYGGRLLSTGEYEVISFFVTYMAVLQGAETAGVWLSLGHNVAQASAADNHNLKVRGSRNKEYAMSSEFIPDTE